MVTTEEVSWKTIQTNPKAMFLCLNVEGHIRDYEGGQPANDPRVCTRATREYMHLQLVIHETRE